jgi:hypothetical protein
LKRAAHHSVIALRHIAITRDPLGWWQKMAGL